MTGVEGRGPNRVERAEQRLQAALDRLQAAARASGTLKDDTAAQAAQVTDLMAENDRLRALLTTTSERLEGTIAKFKTKLAG